MIDKIFINSIFNKFEKLFFKKTIHSIVTLTDNEEEEEIKIDNINYIKIDNDYIGIFLNSPNPFFSKSFIDDMDTFNLYAHYNSIKKYAQEINGWVIHSITLVFSADYNEFVGFYFCNDMCTHSFSMIFMTEELKFFVDSPFNNFVIEMDNNVQYIKSKVLFSINEANNNWTVLDLG